MTTRLVTAKEAAKMVARAVDTVNTWVRRGRLVPAGRETSADPRYPRVRHLYRVEDVLACDRESQRRRCRRRGTYGFMR